jgi:hypothetical protein
MSPKAQIPSSVWELLEQLYLEAVDSRAKGAFAGLSEVEKRTLLKDFAKKQAVGSKRWANIALNLLSAELAL